MRLLFLGPPGSGKSSIIKHVSNLFAIEFSNLDSIVASRFAASFPQPKLPLQQAFIAAAVRELIIETADCVQRIVELPYHDYSKLINIYKGWFESFDHIIAMFAPIHLLLSRNSLRDDPIPEPYIIECANMFELYRPNLRSCFITRYNEIDTGQKSKEESLRHVIRVISGLGNNLIVSNPEEPKPG